MTTEEELAALEYFLAHVDMNEGPKSAGLVVGGIMHHLRAVGLSTQSLRPVLQLQMALSDHEEGKPNSLLAVVKRSGKRSHIADENFKLCAAVIMTLLQRCGSTKSAASQTVANRLRAAGIDVSEKSIDGWHREISNRRHHDDGLCQAYDDLVAEYSNGPDMKQTAYNLLDGLIKMPRGKL